MLRHFNKYNGPINDFILQKLLKTYSLCYFSKIGYININIFKIQMIWPVACFLIQFLLLVC